MTFGQPPSALEAPVGPLHWTSVGLLAPHMARIHLFGLGGVSHVRAFI